MGNARDSARSMLIGTMILLLCWSSVGCGLVEGLGQAAVESADYGSDFCRQIRSTCAYTPENCVGKVTFPLCFTP